MKNNSVLALFGMLVFAVQSHGQSLDSFAWRTGQVIAISEQLADPSTLFFEAATGSRFGHVGVVVLADKDVRIYESDPKLEGTGFEPLKDFLARSQDGTAAFDYTVLEPATALTDEQTLKLVNRAEQLDKNKIPYNFSQTYVSDGSKLNCSEYVYSLFQYIGIANVGQVETVKEAVNLSAFNGGLAKLNDMFEGPAFPKPEDKILSPLSVVKSPALKVIRTTLPVAKVLSDQEIFDAWQKGDGFTAMIAIRAMMLDPAPTPYAKLQSIKNSPELGPQLAPVVKQYTDVLQSGGPLSAKPFRSFPSNWRQD